MVLTWAVGIHCHYLFELHALSPLCTVIFEPYLDDKCFHKCNEPTRRQTPLVHSSPAHRPLQMQAILRDRYLSMPLATQEVMLYS